MALTTFDGGGSDSETTQERCLRDSLVAYAGDDFEDAGFESQRNDVVNEPTTLLVAPVQFRPQLTLTNAPSITSAGLDLSAGDRVDYDEVDGYRSEFALEFDFKFDDATAGSDAGLQLGWEDENNDQCRVFVGDTGEFNVAGDGSFIVSDTLDYTDGDFWEYDTEEHTVRLEKTGDTFELFMDGESVGSNAKSFTLANPTVYITNSGNDTVYVTRWVIY